MSDSTLFLGDEITIQVKIDGAQNNVRLDLPEMEGLTFRQLGPPASSSQTIIVNGRMTAFSGLVYSIAISAEHTGVYEIPGIEIVHEGRTYRSEGFKFIVKESDQQQTMKVIVETAKTSFYWQEPVILSLKWLVQDDIEEYNFRFPLLLQKDALTLKLLENIGSGNSVDIMVEGYQLPFAKKGVRYEGESFTEFSIDIIAYPSVVGTFKIPSASVKVMVKEGSELRKDFFGRMVRTPKLKPIVAVSHPIQLNILPLPEQNRPQSFTGAVGQFQISSSITGVQFKVGDPIELSIRISGEGRYDKIEPPLLSEMSAFSESFVVSSNPQPGDIQPDGILFKQVLRPRHEQVTSIPAIPFSYFDPQKGEYQIRKSQPIHIDVLPAEHVKKEDIVVPKTPDQFSSRPLAREQKGIYANYVFEDALEPHMASWSWGLLLLLPPLSYLVLSLMVSQKRRLQEHTFPVRSKIAGKTAFRNLKHVKKLVVSEEEEFWLALSATLKQYLSDKLNLGAGEVTTVDIRRLSEKGLLPVESSERLVVTLEKMDRLRFGLQKATQKERLDLVAEISNLILSVEKELR